jgi:PilZ domain
MGILQSRQAQVSLPTAISLKRAVKRTNINVPVLLVCNGQGFRGWINDLSEHGAGIISTAALHIGDQIEVMLSAAGLETPLKLRAVVKHSTGFHHGCAFLASDGSGPESLRHLVINSRSAG